MSKKSKKPNEWNLKFIATDDEFATNRERIMAEFEKSMPESFPEDKKEHITTAADTLAKICFNDVRFRYLFGEMYSDVLITLEGIDGISICSCIHLDKPVNDIVNFTFLLGKRWLNRGRGDCWRVITKAYKEAQEMKRWIESNKGK